MPRQGIRLRGRHLFSSRRFPTSLGTLPRLLGRTGSRLLPISQAAADVAYARTVFPVELRSRRGGSPCPLSGRLGGLSDPFHAHRKFGALSAGAGFSVSVRSFQPHANGSNRRRGRLYDSLRGCDQADPNSQGRHAQGQHAHGQDSQWRLGSRRGPRDSVAEQIRVGSDSHRLPGRDRSPNSTCATRLMGPGYGRRQCGRHRTPVASPLCWRRLPAAVPWPPGWRFSAPPHASCQ